jgi:flap endonuclease-1
MQTSNSIIQISNGKNINHIHAILLKTLSLLKNKIKPIFVFDGKPPDIKNFILDTRKKTKSKTKQIINDINIELENSSDDSEKIILQEKLKKLSARIITIGLEEIQECKQVLTLLGIPFIDAPEEADSQCAWLSKNNIVDYVASEDMDLLTFGTKKLLRGLNSKNKIIEYNIQDILEKLEIKQDEFIDLCILLGCDYCPKLNKIGPKKALNLILKHKNIKNIIENEKIKTDIDYEKVKSYFMNPPIKEIEKKDIQWNVPKYDELRELLITKYEYDDEKLSNLFNTLQGGYYSVICGQKDKITYDKEKKEYYTNILNSISFDD